MNHQKTIFFVLVGCLFFSRALSQGPQPIAEIIALRGVVEVYTDSAWLTAQQGHTLTAGNTIRTGDDGWVAILMLDETRLHLNRNSRFVFAQVAPKAGWLERVSQIPIVGSLYQLLSGEVFIENDNRDILIDVEAPTIKAGIRGTSFLLHAPSEAFSELTVLDGRVLASHVENPQNTLTASAGDRVLALAGEPLRLERLDIQPQDAVQWVLYLPPLLVKGEMDQASAVVSGALQYASNDMRLGRLTEAYQNLQGLTERYPAASEPWRLLALVQLLLGDKQNALTAAEQAVQAAPESAAALLSLSYVMQAFFDLPQATALTHRALEFDANNVLAWLNLARLRFGSDDSQAAWQALLRAQQLAPDNAEVHNLRGFLLLARNDTMRAIDAFLRAAALDRRIGEPHLGLALAYMRQGQPESALKALATAVLLEPRRSLFMSYWAKLLHQVKRFDKALAMLELAKRYDAQDPTPHFYEALILRDLNRPSEGIRALNRAIDLNDRRGVYRSRFLLDRDLAVRNVDLAELYKQLGLTAWAQNRAFKSIKQDFTNYSAHTLLAGALAEEPDRALAQAGEALLGRLLQPGNVNSFTTFNDYTALFEQPAIQGEFTVAKGSHDALESEALFFGAVPSLNMAFNMGAVYADTDGWRDTNGERFSDVAGVIKWDITPDDSLLVTASRARSELQDEFYPRFEFDFPADPIDRIESHLTRWELGYHHHAGPRSDLLLFLSRVETDGNQLEHSSFQVFDDLPEPTIESFDHAEFDNPYWQLQGQYSTQWKGHQFTFGTLQYWIDHSVRVQREDYLNDGDEQTLLGAIKAGNDLDSRFQSYYVLDTWDVLPSWALDAGLYFDRLETGDAFSGAEWTIEALNPRLGVIWQPTERDTFRLAAFRYLLPLATARLDPMDVAGVSLYRNGLLGSETEEISLVWEREWTSGFFSASLFYQDIEYSRKQLQAGGTTAFDTRYGHSKGIDLRWNQLLPWPGTALTANYRYLDVHNDSLYTLTGGDLPATDRAEHLFAVDLNYVAPGGFFANARQTYRSIDSEAADRPNENFWITDLKLGFEFPEKRGRLQFEVRNLFDQQFNWVTDPFAITSALPTPVPAREFWVSFSYDF